MIELKDSLDVLESELKQASMIEETIFNDYAIDTIPDMRRIRAGYERIQTLHDVLLEIIVSAQKTLREAKERLEVLEGDAAHVKG